MLRTLLVALALTAAAATARADDPGGAGTLHAKAQAAMSEQRFADAAELFHAAFELDPAPELLWNEARARHLAGELERARDLYKQFIERDDAPAALRGRANDSIVEITLALEKPPDGPKAPEAHDDTFGTVMVVTGGALVAGGLIAHLVSFGAADDMTLYATPSAGLDDATRLTKYQDAKSTRDTTQTLAIVGYAVGGAALVTGIVSLVLTDDPAPTSASGAGSGPRIAPWTAPGMVGATASLRF